MAEHTRRGFFGMMGVAFSTGLLAGTIGPRVFNAVFNAANEIYRQGTIEANILDLEQKVTGYAIKAYEKWHEETMKRQGYVHVPESVMDVIFADPDDASGRSAFADIELARSEGGVFFHTVHFYEAADKPVKKCERYKFEKARHKAHLPFFASGDSKFTQWNKSGPLSDGQDYCDYRDTEVGSLKGTELKRLVELYVQTLGKTLEMYKIGHPTTKQDLNFRGVIVEFESCGWGKK